MSISRKYVWRSPKEFQRISVCFAGPLTVVYFLYQSTYTYPLIRVPCVHTSFLFVTFCWSTGKGWLNDSIPSIFSWMMVYHRFSIRSELESRKASDKMLLHEPKFSFSLPLHHISSFSLAIPATTSAQNSLVYRLKSSQLDQTTGIFSWTSITNPPLLSVLCLRAIVGIYLYFVSTTHNYFIRRQIPAQLWGMGEGWLILTTNY